MAMDLCIDEKDEERESEAQSDVRAKKRARGGGGVGRGEGELGGARFFALTSRSSSFSSMQRSIAISLSMFCAENGRFAERLFAARILKMRFGENANTTAIFDIPKLFKKNKHLF